MRNIITSEESDDDQRRDSHNHQPGTTMTSGNDERSVAVQQYSQYSQYSQYN